MPALPRWSPSCPQRRRGNCLLVGALPDVVEDQALALLAALGIGPVRVLPARRSGDAPAVGPNTVFALTQPFLADTRRGADPPGRAPHPRPLPLRRRGHDALAAAPSPPSSACRDAVFEAATAAPRARARKAVAAQAETLRDRTLFLFPDSQLEVPLARFLARECGMRPLEVGTPYLHRDILGPELDLLPDRACPLRRAGCRPPARPRPRAAPRPDGLRPWPRQPAGGRGAGHQMGHRARLHARSISTNRRAISQASLHARCAAARCSRRGNGWRRPNEADRLDI